MNPTKHNVFMGAVCKSFAYQFQTLKIVGQLLGYMNIHKPSRLVCYFFVHCAVCSIRVFAKKINMGDSCHEDDWQSMLD